MTKPFVKWAGGKTQLLDQLVARLPEGFKRYHEPMLGGGALFWRLRDLGLADQCLLSDINEELVNCYVTIRDHSSDLFGQLSRLAKKKDINTRETFEMIRAQDPSNQMGSVARAARFIYLNKTCFNGLYRVNKSGQFNAPFGKYKNPKIFDEENLRACNAALRGVAVTVESFHTVVKRAKEDDFVYFDPPYIPLSETADFTSFTKDGFDEVDHQVLANIFDELADKGVYVMLSNSDTPLTRELYNGYEIDVVPARRSINRDGGKRGSVNEVIVRNY